MPDTQNTQKKRKQIRIEKEAEALQRNLAKRKKQKPLFSPYALKVILENGNYSHEKATQELGYNPRSLEETLSDTVDWLKETGEIKEKRTGMRRSRKKVHA